MRYTLVIVLKYSHSHDRTKTANPEEYFDAENLDTAVVIAKAMLQSIKIKYEKKSNNVEELSGFLWLGTQRVVWKSNLVSQVTQTKKEIVTPEHFNEEFIPSS